MLKGAGGWKLLIGVAGAVLVLGYLLLLIPESSRPVPETAAAGPFAWNADEHWKHLEGRFAEARARGCPRNEPFIAAGLDRAEETLRELESGPRQTGDPIFGRLEQELFELAPLLAACPERLADFASLTFRIRRTVKNLSGNWDMNSSEARTRVYRLLYGGRAALEEVVLQAHAGALGEMQEATPEPSATPSARVLGVTVHSGDLLVSRGGAPTSALIARGNDYPGNFSHVALLHVNEETSLASIVEAHIEQGVTVTTLKEYLEDVKLRVMVLRLRADLPALKEDPTLPHKAASIALKRATESHIPYDFKMDFKEHSALFCSEVASAAYEQFGVQLWTGTSTISSRGLAGWLSAFGVENFYTQEPSDLEYDPQLTVVAEWRDRDTLWQDHLDNAVVDVMLEGAEQGATLDYDWYLLPVARVAKAYSVLLNQAGGVGPVPEGMSATAALRNQRFERTHRELKTRLEEGAREFKSREGYVPPYWELVRLGRKPME